MSYLASRRRSALGLILAFLLLGFPAAAGAGDEDLAPSIAAEVSFGPRPAPPLKTINVFWCLVDDGLANPPPLVFVPVLAGNPPIAIPVPVQKSLNQNPGPPRARFNRLIREKGLAVKNQIFAPAGIQFKTAGTVVVADPRPNLPPFQQAGEIGDVVDPGDGLRDPRDDDPLPSPFFDPDFNPLLASRGEAGGGGAPNPGGTPGQGLRPETGRAELVEIYRSCRKAIGDTAKEYLIEVVIRRFVRPIDGDGDGLVDEDTVADNTDDDARIDNVNPGRDGEDPIDLGRIYGIAPVGGNTPTVVDPDRIPLGPAPPAFGPARRARRDARWGKVLAHENGHALGLRHARAGLMAGTAPPWAPNTLDPNREIPVLRASAQTFSMTEDKDENGLFIEREAPLAREQTDEIGDAKPAWLDLQAATVTREPGGSLRVTVELADVLPDVLPDDVEAATFQVAVDVDRNPFTGQRVDAFGGQRLGADLVLDLALAAEAGEMLASATLRGDKPRPVESWPERVALSPGEPDEVPLYDRISVRLPAEDLAQPLAAGYLVWASSRIGHAVVDSVPVVEGEVHQYRPPARIRVEPEVAGPGERVQLQGWGFAPTSFVSVLWGGRVVVAAKTWDDGSFSIEMDAPKDLDPLRDAAPIRFDDGSAVVPITVFDEAETSQLCWLEWKQPAD